MNQYSLTKHRTLQWLIILLFFIGGTGTYFYLRSRAAQTVVDNAPSFEAPLTTTLDLARGIGGPTFSRADGADRRATVTDFEGLIKPVKNGEARFEGARRVENLLTYSEDFNNGSWSKARISSVSVDQAMAPNSTMTADKITTSGVADPLVQQQVNTGATLANRTFRLSFWLWTDAGQPTTNYQMFMYDSTVTYIGQNNINITNTPTRYSLLYTFPAGATSTSINGRFDPPDTNTAGNYLYAWGAQLEEVTGQANQNPSEYVSTNVKTTTPYHGANVDGVKYFATQNGNTVASNVVTEATGTAIPDATLKGYLAEGTRTNLLKRSEELDNAFSAWASPSRASLSPNVIVSPGGTTTADKLVENTSVTNSHYIYQSFAVTSGQTYTMSVYAKAGERPSMEIQYYATNSAFADSYALFNLSTGVVTSTYGGVTATIQSIGNGWYRCTATQTALATVSGNISFTLHNGTGVVYTGDGTSGLYLWGAQLERANFASSYIPTTTASVARARDDLKYINASNFNDAVGATAADVTTEWSGGAGADTYFFDNSSTSQRMSMWHWNSLANMIIVDRSSSGGTRNNFDYSSSTITAGTQMRLAQRWTSTANALFRDGSLRGSDTTLTLPYDAISGIAIGQAGTTYAEAYATIKNVRSWKQAMSDTFINNLTSLTPAISNSAINKSTLLNTGESLRADLTSTLDLQTGVGGPTFSRTDGADRRATVTDFEGLIRPVKNGEARFEGARRAENLVTYSEDLSSAAWNKGSGMSVDVNASTAPDGTLTADRLNLGSNAGLDVFNQVVQTTTAYPQRLFVATIYLKGEGGDIGKQVNIDIRRHTGAFVGTSKTPITLTGGWQKVSTEVLTTLSDTVGMRFYIGQPASNYAASVLAWGAQLEEVTGQANQNPSEYVSTNVKTASPYHGANVDGVKYFATQNGNTVSSNVVTEATGTAIPDATLKGYLAEGTRTNIFLHSEIESTWTAVGTTNLTNNAVVAPSGKMSAASILSSSTTSDVRAAHIGNMTVSPSTTYTISAYVKPVGETFTYIQVNNQVSGVAAVGYFNLTSGATSTADFIAGFTNKSATATAVGNGWWRIVFILTTDTSSTGLNFYVGPTGSISSRTYTGTVGNGIYFWGAQLEQASFASSYIPTTSASITRGTDSLSYPISNMEATIGSAYLEFTPHWSTKLTGESYEEAKLIYPGTNPERIIAVEGTQMDMYDGSSPAAYSAPTYTTDVLGRYAGRWGSGGKILYRNGIAGTSVSFDGSFSISPGPLIISQNGKSFGNIKNIRIWKKALTDAQLQGVTSTNDAVARSAIQKTTLNVNQNSQSTNGLIGLWSFNGPDISGTTAYDRSGNNNNGTLTNGPTVTEGRVGQALQFDGVDDYVNILDPVSGVLDFGTGDFAVSAWVRTVETDGQNCIVSKAGGPLGFRFGYEVGKPYYLIGDGTTYNEGAIGTATLNDGLWHHLAINYLNSTNTAQAYIDGISTGSETFSAAIGSISDGDSVRIGRMSTFGSNGKVNGSIDEVRLYNRALSATEIASLYNLGR